MKLLKSTLLFTTMVLSACTSMQSSNSENSHYGDPHSRFDDYYNPNCSRYEPEFNVGQQMDRNGNNHNALRTMPPSGCPSN